MASPLWVFWIIRRNPTDQTETWHIISGCGFSKKTSELNRGEEKSKALTSWKSAEFPFDSQFEQKKSRFPSLYLPPLFICGLIFHSPFAAFRVCWGFFTAFPAVWVICSLFPWRNPFGNLVAKQTNMSLGKIILIILFIYKMKIFIVLSFSKQCVFFFVIWVAFLSSHVIDT